MALGSMRPQFTLKTLLGVFVLAAAILGVWRVFFTPEAWIHQITAGGKVAPKCFTVGCLCGAERCGVIFSVDGRLPPRKWLKATLYSVQQGKTRWVSSISMGVQSQDPLDVIASGFEVRFALCECDNSLGPVLMLGVAGHRRAAGHGWFLRVRRRATNVNVLMGPVQVGRPTISYVEGDTSIIQPMMTVPAFAERNSRGEYIVVTTELGDA